MGGYFEVDIIRTPELLKKYKDFVRCDSINEFHSHDYCVRILKGRRNRQLPCTVDPQEYPRICHILENRVHVHQGVHDHQYGERRSVVLVEMPTNPGTHDIAIEEQ